MLVSYSWLGFKDTLQLADYSHCWVGAGIFQMRLSRHEGKEKSEYKKENTEASYCHSKECPLTKHTKKIPPHNRPGTEMQISTKEIW